jgi:hypothetical protein
MYSRIELEQKYFVNNVILNVSCKQWRCLHCIMYSNERNRPHYTVIRLIMGTSRTAYRFSYIKGIARDLVCYPRIPISDHSDIGFKGSQSNIIFDIGLTFLAISDI